MKYNRFFIFPLAAALVCPPLQAAVKIAPKGHDARCVWAGPYSFAFKIDPDTPATKVFFYGFYLPDGSVSYNGYEINRKDMSFCVSCYSYYRHRKVKTTLENVLATGSSTFTGRKIAQVMDKDGRICQLDFNKTYSVRVSVKDKNHTVNLFQGDKKIGSVTYDASMLYKGEAPKKIFSFMNKPFAVKDADDCPVLQEHPRKSADFQALKKPENETKDEAKDETKDAEAPSRENTPVPPAAEISAQTPPPAQVPAGEVDAPDAEGETPLMRAAMRKDYQLVRELMRRGASAKTKNGRGISPFQYAADTCNAELMQVFVSESIGAK